MTPGPGWLTPFERSPYSLRFELGGGFSNLNDPIRRFTQAYDRARAVADDVFQRSTRLWAIVLWFDQPSDLTAQPRSPGMATLASLGFDTSRPLSSWDELPPWLEGEDPDTHAGHWSAFDLSSDRSLRDVLLWCAIADEMPVRPDAAVVSYILDPDADVLMHVYDDRGMDLTGLSESAIKPLYKRFDKWLLDYDRDRMTKIFDQSSGT